MKNIFANILDFILIRILDKINLVYNDKNDLVYIRLFFL